MLDDIPAYFSLLLQHDVLLDPLSFPTIRYFTDELLAVGHICFLCSGHSGVSSLVPLIFRVFFLVTAAGGVGWVGMGVF